MTRVRAHAMMTFAAATVWLAPAHALACPMCIASNEANRDAFLGTTVLLSLLPLAMFAAFLGYLLHRLAARRSDVVARSPVAAHGSAERPVIAPAQSPTTD